MLGLAWASAVYQYGAEEPLPGRWAALGVALAALVLWIPPRRSERAAWRLADVLPAGLLLGIAAVQLVPLPLAVVRLISPHRAAQVAAASAVLGPIHSATLSSVPAATRDGFLILATYVAVFLLAGDLVRRLRTPWMAAAPILVVGLLEAGLGVVQTASGSEALGTYVNHNHFAGLLEMSLPFALLQAFHVLARGRRGGEVRLEAGIVACLFFGLAAMMLVAVVDSRSRMGFLATLAGIFVCAAMLLWNRARRRGRGMLVRFWLPVAAVAAVLPVAVVFLASDPMIGRMAGEQDDTRQRLWKESVPLVADYKVAGCGLGAYESCFLPYKRVVPNLIADRAHNDYIQLMAELGIPAFCCIVALALMAWWTALRRGASQHLAIACAAALTAILLHSFVDFNLYVPANGMLAAWVAGMGRHG